MTKTLAVIVLLPALCGAADTFETEIQPILRAKCSACHNSSSHTSGFSIASQETILAGGARHGAAVSAGNPEESVLIRMLKGDIKPQMPLGKALSADEIAKISAWISELKPELTKSDQKPYWAFTKPVKLPAPEVNGMVRNEIDAFVLKKLAEKGLSMAAEADRRTLIRRVYADLIGLPPTPADTKAFLNDPSPTAYENLIEKLLEDPRYGERWGRHWLDLARYADTNGYEGDPEWPHAWRYRNYVIDAFNKDKPYDQFIREQIAGDEFFEIVSAVPAPPPEPEQAVALSFLRMAPFNRTPVSEENRDSWLSEMTSTVGSVFLGMTIGCAKCHDHKYDSVPQKDFYRMKAFFSTVTVPSTGRAGGAEPAEFYRPGEKEWAEKLREKEKQDLASLVAAFDKFQEPLIAKLTEARKRDDPKFEGKLGPKDVEKEVNSDNNNAAGFDKRPDLLTAAEKAEWRTFNEKITRKKKAIERLEPQSMGLHNTDGPPFGPNAAATHVLIRGDYDHPGEARGAWFPECHRRAFQTRRPSASTDTRCSPPVDAE